MDTYHVKLALSSTSKKIAYYYNLWMRIFCALLCGLGITFAFLQGDPWFKQIVKEQIEHIIQDISKTNFSCEVTQINLFIGQITLEAVNGSEDNQEKWSFDCPVLLFNFSWSGLIFRSTLEASLLFQRAVVVSEFKNGIPAIQKPLELLINAPSLIPFALDTCALRQAQVTLFNQEFDADLKLHFSSDTFIRKNLVKTTATCSDGCLHVRNQSIFSDLGGAVIVDAPIDAQFGWAWQAHGSMKGEPLVSSSNRCTLSAEYNNGIGSLELYNNVKSVWLAARSIKYHQENISTDVELAVNLNEISRSFMPYLRYMNNGILGGRGQVVLNVQKSMFNGSLKADNIKIIDFDCDQIALMIEGNTQAAHGFVTITNLAGMHAGGSWQWNGHTCNGVITNTHKCNPGEVFTIDPGDACAKITFDNQRQLKADYVVAFILPRDSSKHKLTGLFEITKNSIMCSGLFDDLPYQLNCDKQNAKTNPVDYLSGIGFKSFSCKTRSGVELFGLHAHSEPNKITGVIDGKVVSALLSSCIGENVQTEGKIRFGGSLEGTLLKMHTEFNNANIRVPYCHNIIQDVDGSLVFDLIKRAITIENINIKLHKGSVTSLVSTLAFGPQWQLDFAHVPLKFNNCLVTWQKEFFGLLSGVVTGIYKANGSMLLGNFMLDKSHLRSNLLSGQVQNDILATTMGSLMRYKTDCNFDINFVTQAPVKVKTPFLETKARIKLFLKGTLYRPEISGALDLQEGTLFFPYKPLYISEAKLLLTPQELDDPTISLRAKNKIKKYNVSMQVSGSLKQPKISFESSPMLEEEQIITLLLAGSEEGLLYLVMPHVITQALENLLFGPAESSSKWQRYLVNTLKPLKNIRLIPGSVDPAGKGVQGGLEIDITDKLSASIQQNLSLLDDTKVELDYALSDDISIRGTKDEGGNLGGEVEMRWKF